MSGSRKEDTASILFIKLVNVRECLWNYTCTDYSKTDVTSAAWREIALELNDSGECIVLVATEECWYSDDPDLQLSNTFQIQTNIYDAKSK